MPSGQPAGRRRYLRPLALSFFTLHHYPCHHPPIWGIDKHSGHAILLRSSRYALNLACGRQSFPEILCFTQVDG